ncbi:hypothetical protein V5O48_006164 [Marasmius crinis-equi]|uniref:Uncharacterized protein n=1 Tax=Marasmius crinis-equi TaxID=585013 RepID=A0ABR3FK84_9AGAR
MRAHAPASEKQQTAMTTSSTSRVRLLTELNELLVQLPEDVNKLQNLYDANSNSKAGPSRIAPKDLRAFKTDILTRMRRRVRLNLCIYAFAPVGPGYKDFVSNLDEVREKTEQVLTQTPKPSEGYSTKTEPKKMEDSDAWAFIAHVALFNHRETAFKAMELDLAWLKQAVSCESVDLTDDELDQIGYERTQCDSLATDYVSGCEETPADLKAKSQRDPEDLVFKRWVLESQAGFEAALTRYIRQG